MIKQREQLKNYYGYDLQGNYILIKAFVPQFQRRADRANQGPSPPQQSAPSVLPGKSAGQVVGERRQR